LVFGFVFLGILAMWLYSHLWPDSFGSCREVPLNLGLKASIRECQAYATTEFVVPIAVAALGLLLLGTGDIKLTIPGLGTIERTREGKQAADVLKQETETVDERGAKFLEGLSSIESAPPPGRR
jgi:hypothetical protein